ncbi:MAG TPA: hypothetical protein EYG99_02885 [Candidatus Pacebacteria bacterium]|nr:hypothetical protein [Candidatus Paceibacterota bacterium]
MFHTTLQSIISETTPTRACITPIFKLYNTKIEAHPYTRGTADRDKVLSTWSEFEFTDSGPAFWAGL